jgi:hypothetical protein
MGYKAIFYSGLPFDSNQVLRITDLNQNNTVLLTEIKRPSIKLRAGKISRQKILIVLTLLFFGIVTIA